MVRRPVGLVSQRYANYKLVSSFDANHGECGRNYVVAPDPRIVSTLVYERHWLSIHYSHSKVVWAHLVKQYPVCALDFGHIYQVVPMWQVLV